MNLSATHVYPRRVVCIPNVKFKELLHHVHVCLNILDHHRIVDLNVLAIVNVPTI